jgi:endonuclease-3
VAAAVPDLLRRLHAVYGPLRWRPHRDPMSELILTILSQHTADRLSGLAFIRLTERYSDWEQLREAPVEEIEARIQPAGLSHMKAPRLKRVLDQVLSDRGGYDLAFLADLPLQESKAWLMALPGVGPKTAACVLMFALGRPALPVDTHVYRVARRLGLIPPKMSADRAHEQLESIVPQRDIYAFHVGLIKHGRYTCVAQRPHCEACVLNDICPSAFSAALPGAPADQSASPRT